MRAGWKRFYVRLFWGAWFLLFLPGSIPGEAAELVNGPEVRFEGTRPVVRWKTDVSTASRVFFGEDSRRMTQRAEGAQGAEHEVTLPTLSAGTRWYYTVGTARVPLATNSFVVPGKAVGEVSSAPKVDSTAKAPPTAKTWGHLASLEDHFRRHGGDFKAKNPDDYARMAWEFQQRAKREGLPTKIDSEGVVRIYDPKTGAFGAYNRNGTTRTFFKPNSPGYFDRQPGELVKGKKD